MNIKNKIIPVALSLFIGVGSLGIANAAIPVDYQAKMASWIKNDPNPSPKSSTNNTGDNNSPKNVEKNNGTAGKQNYTKPNMNNNLDNQMVQNCIQVDQQLMPNMTPEQMLEMDKTWNHGMAKRRR